MALIGSEYAKRFVSKKQLSETIRATISLRFCSFFRDNNAKIYKILALLKECEKEGVFLARSKRQRAQAKGRKKGNYIQELQKTGLSHEEAKALADERFGESAKTKRIKQAIQRDTEKITSGEHIKEQVNRIFEKMHKEKTSVKSIKGQTRKMRVENGEKGNNLGNEKHVGKANSFSTVKKYQNTIKSICNSENIKDLKELNNDVIERRVRNEIENFYGGDSTAAGRINSMISASNALFEASKLDNRTETGLTSDFGYLREEVKENKITRSRDTSTWLQADSSDVKTSLIQIQKRIEDTSDTHLKSKLEILRDKIEFQYHISGRTQSTVGTKIDEIYKFEDGYDVLIARDKGDKSRVMNVSSNEGKSCIERCIEKATNDDKESLFQLRDKSGKLMSIEASEKELSRLFKDTVDIKKEEIVSPTRTNQFLKKEGKSELNITVIKRMTSHSVRKAGAMEKGYYIVEKLSQCKTPEEKNQLKNEILKEKIKEEERCKEYLKNREEKYGAKYKQTESENKVEDQYRFLLTHRSNNQRREKELEHLGDRDFARFIVSIELGHSRISVVDSYINHKEFKEFCNSKKGD